MNKLLVILLFPAVVLADTVSVTREVIREESKYVTVVRYETENGQVTERVIKGEVLPNGSIRRIGIDRNTGLPYNYYIKPSIFAGADPGSFRCNGKEC